MRILFFSDFFANSFQHCVNSRPVLWFDEQAEAFQLFFFEFQGPEFLVVQVLSRWAELPACNDADGSGWVPSGRDQLSIYLFRNVEKYRARKAIL